MFSFLSYLKINIDTIFNDNKYGVVYQCLNDVNIWTLTQQLKKKFLMLMNKNPVIF